MKSFQQRHPAALEERRIDNKLRERVQRPQIILVDVTQEVNPILQVRSANELLDLAVMVVEFAGSNNVQVGCAAFDRGSESLE